MRRSGRSTDPRGAASRRTGALTPRCGPPATSGRGSASGQARPAAEVGRVASTRASCGATEATTGRCRGPHTTAATKGGRYGSEGYGWASGQGASSCRRGARARGSPVGGPEGVRGAPPRDVATQGRSTSALGVATRGAAPTGPASSALLWCRGAPTRAHGPRRSARTEGCSGGGGATTSVATEGPAATYRSAALRVPWYPT